MTTAALAVGVLVAVQSRINAELAGYVGGGLIAAAISFGTGLVLAAVLILSRRQLRNAFAAIPSLVRAGRLQWWQLLGGVGGAWLVTTQGLVVGAVGVTVFTIGVVAGQVGGSLVVDRAGLRTARHRFQKLGNFWRVSDSIPPTLPVFMATLQKRHKIFSSWRALKPMPLDWPEQARPCCSINILGPILTVLGARSGCGIEL